VNYPAILDELGRGEPVQLTGIGGGCIAEARVATFADGSRVFVKMIHEAPKKAGFFESFGRAFARLHDHRGPSFGFPHDNFIGSTPQCNEPLDGPWAAGVDEEAVIEDGSRWPEFFLVRRLRFQAKLAASSGHGHEIEQLLDRSEGLITDLLSASIEPPSILHGDLWGGNFIVDERGEACLIDPAVYYGHREADLAMTRLFGGFGSEFYAAYDEASPLAPGHEDRLPVYQLYHLLNHLNLFGAAYYAQSLRILRRYAVG
jgi:fructosamine-3-kinase